jgi:hypothetical protein
MRISCCAFEQGAFLAWCLESEGETFEVGGGSSEGRVASSWCASKNYRKIADLEVNIQFRIDILCFPLYSDRHGDSKRLQ